MKTKICLKKVTVRKLLLISLAIIYIIWQMRAHWKDNSEWNKVKSKCFSNFFENEVKMRDEEEKSSFFSIW